ncbi:MAG TPA: cupin domain-containing protein [Phycisphaerae bacterium]|nr:cupin domain-containing protein [Phycisphaerae bacterium]
MLMVETCFPPFAEEWPEAKLDFEGLTGRVLKGPQGLTIFMAADRDVEVPKHRHGAQWGIVLAGSMELTLGGKTERYGPGQTHYIPADVEHEATLYAGWRGLYIFDRSSGLRSALEQPHARVHHG